MKSVASCQQDKFKQFFSKPVTTPLENKVKEAEIKLSALVAEHNLSFLLMNDLSEVLKECFPDSKIAENIKLKRNKCTEIVKNVIGHT